ncbi:hypothetical protein MJN85_28215, partial [Salmonella enterica subsp. enterica serovar Anatum]|nr:hypothetical protein [Salmonella enterica subsp. enterica serovar Anatum]
MSVMFDPQAAIYPFPPKPTPLNDDEKQFYRECGGTFIFALMSHAQIRNDMSNKRKEEARLRGERLERERKKAE